MGFLGSCGILVYGMFKFIRKKSSHEKIMTIHGYWAEQNHESAKTLDDNVIVVLFE